jgi:hypothetical protein
VGVQARAQAVLVGAQQDKVTVTRSQGIVQLPAGRRVRSPVGDWGAVHLDQSVPPKIHSAGRSPAVIFGGP